jgi:hypothetical protein
MPSRAPRALIQIAARPETAVSQDDPPSVVVPPVAGEKRTIMVGQTTFCTSFVSALAAGE